MTNVKVYAGIPKPKQNYNDPGGDLHPGGTTQVIYDVSPIRETYVCMLSFPGQIFPSVLLSLSFGPCCLNTGKPVGFMFWKVIGPLRDEII